MGGTLETWIYAGARILDGKRVTLWRDQGGDMITYPESEGWVIGGIYEVNVDRAGDRLTRSHPIFMKRHPDADEITAWEALDHRAVIRLARMLREGDE